MLIAGYRPRNRESRAWGSKLKTSAIRAYQQMTGCTIIASYTEVETGKKDDLTNRPELRKAIAHAKRSKATLVIGKLDRLVARSRSWVS